MNTDQRLDRLEKRAGITDEPTTYSAQEACVKMGEGYRVDFQFCRGSHCWYLDGTNTLRIEKDGAAFGMQLFLESTNRFVTHGLHPKADVFAKQRLRPSLPDPPEGYAKLLDSDGNWVKRRVHRGVFFCVFDGRAELWSRGAQSDDSYYILTRLPDKGTLAWAKMGGGKRVKRKGWIHWVKPCEMTLTFADATATDWEVQDESE